jgi:hypothetical protein
MKYLMLILLAVVVSVAMLAVTALLTIRYRRPNLEICPACKDMNAIGPYGYFECECGHVWHPAAYYRAQVEAQEKES